MLLTAIQDRTPEELVLHFEFEPLIVSTPLESAIAVAYGYSLAYIIVVPDVRSPV